MTEKLDAKFYGTIRKAKDGSIVPDDQYMVFLVKDNAFMPTLEYYREQCVRLRCNSAHLRSVDRAIARARRWRDANPDKLKKPDAAGERLLDQPNERTEADQP